MGERDQSPGDIEALLASEGRRSKRRYGIAALVVLALAGAAYWGYTAWLGGGGAADVRYLTAQVARGKLVATVTATGAVEPTNEVEISSELSGTVRKVHADYNDRVTAGEVLAELDTAKLEAQAAHSRANLAARKAKVAEAEVTVEEKSDALERVRSLSAQSYSSIVDLDTATAEHSRAVAALESARADVAVAEADVLIDETNLRKARIVSPIDGIVLVRNIEIGQTVASTLQAPTLFTVAENLASMQLEVDIDEADIGQVREGQDATFTVEAYQGRDFPARISKIRYASETVSGVVTYKALLSIDNADLLLRPGMTATATIVVERIEDALLVPNAALRFAPPVAPEASESGGGILSRILPRPPSGNQNANRRQPPGSRVWVLKDGAPVAVPVETGASDGERTVILSDGLAEGDVVIVDMEEAG